MRRTLLCCTTPLCAAVALSVESNDKNAIREGFWNNPRVYRVLSQCGGPYLTDDSYLEWELSNREGVFDLYDYVDYKNLFDDASSDIPDGENWSVDIGPRLSIDRLLGRDSSVGPIREWFVAFDYYYIDAHQGPGPNVLWSSIDTNTELSWLGTVGPNLYAHYIDKSYDASDENARDGYVVRMNWFKPLVQFGGKRFIASQDFFGYEFNSKPPDKGDAFEREYHIDNGFQAHLELWYHTRHWKFGYGVKVYHNMIQQHSGEQLDGRRTDSNETGHYFNVGYAF